MGSIPMILRLMAHLSAIVAASVIVMNLGGTMMLAGSPKEAALKSVIFW